MEAVNGGAVWGGGGERLYHNIECSEMLTNVVITVHNDYY